MFRIRTRLVLIFLAVFAIGFSLGFRANIAEAYNDQVYNSLKRTRDALIGQKNSIQKAIYQTDRKIDDLEAHKRTLEDYLRQTEADLRDVERALRR